jgi:hypothetical protein
MEDHTTDGFFVVCPYSDEDGNDGIATVNVEVM